jgi:hypothetical protein
VTGLVSPFSLDAVQWKIRVVTGWKISSVMLVSVTVGSTPFQLTGILVLPENVHTGSPPFLKCGLAARAAEEVRTGRRPAQQGTQVKNAAVP